MWRAAWHIVVVFVAVVHCCDAFCGLAGRNRRLVTIDLRIVGSYLENLVNDDDDDKDQPSVKKASWQPSGGTPSSSSPFSVFQPSSTSKEEEEERLEVDSRKSNDIPPTAPLEEDAVAVPLETTTTKTSTVVSPSFAKTELPQSTETGVEDDTGPNVPLEQKDGTVATSDSDSNKAAVVVSSKKAVNPFAAKPVTASSSPFAAKSAKTSSSPFTMPKGAKSTTTSAKIKAPRTLGSPFATNDSAPNKASPFAPRSTLAKAGQDDCKNKARPLTNSKVPKSSPFAATSQAGSASSPFARANNNATAPTVAAAKFTAPTNAKPFAASSGPKYSSSSLSPFGSGSTPAKDSTGAKPTTFLAPKKSTSPFPPSSRPGSVPPFASSPGAPKKRDTTGTINETNATMAQTKFQMPNSSVSPFGSPQAGTTSLPCATISEPSKKSDQIGANKTNAAMPPIKFQSPNATASAVATRPAFFMKSDSAGKNAATAQTKFETNTKNATALSDVKAPKKSVLPSFDSQVGKAPASPFADADSDAMPMKEKLSSDEAPKFSSASPFMATPLGKATSSPFAAGGSPTLTNASKVGGVDKNQTFAAKFQAPKTSTSPFAKTRPGKSTMSPFAAPGSAKSDTVNGTASTGNTNRASLSKFTTPPKSSASPFTKGKSPPPFAGTTGPDFSSSKSAAPSSPFSRDSLSEKSSSSPIVGNATKFIPPKITTARSSGLESEGSIAVKEPNKTGLHSYAAFVVGKQKSEAEASIGGVVLSNESMAEEQSAPDPDDASHGIDDSFLSSSATARAEADTHDFSERMKNKPQDEEQPRLDVHSDTSETNRDEAAMVESLENKPQNTPVETKETRTARTLSPRTPFQERSQEVPPVESTIIEAGTTLNSIYGSGPAGEELPSDSYDPAAPVLNGWDQIAFLNNEIPVKNTVPRQIIDPIDEWASEVPGLFDNQLPEADLEPTFRWESEFQERRYVDPTRDFRFNVWDDTSGTGNYRGKDAPVLNGWRRAGFVDKELIFKDTVPASVRFDQHVVSVTEESGNAIPPQYMSPEETTEDPSAAPDSDFVSDSVNCREISSGHDESSAVMDGWRDQRFVGKDVVFKEAAPTRSLYDGNDSFDSVSNDDFSHHELSEIDSDESLAAEARADNWDGSPARKESGSVLDGWRNHQFAGNDLIYKDVPAPRLDPNRTTEESWLANSIQEFEEASVEPSLVAPGVRGKSSNTTMVTDSWKDAVVRPNVVSKDTVPDRGFESPPSRKFGESKGFSENQRETRRAPVVTDSWKDVVVRSDVIMKDAVPVQPISSAAASNELRDGPRAPVVTDSWKEAVVRSDFKTKATVPGASRGESAAEARNKSLARSLQPVVNEDGWQDPSVGETTRFKSTSIPFHEQPSINGGQTPARENPSEVMRSPDKQPDKSAKFGVWGSSNGPPAGPALMDAWKNIRVSEPIVVKGEIPRRKP